MFAYSNIIALIKSQLAGGETVQNISGFVDGFTRGDSENYPNGLSILHTADSTEGWNGIDNVVFTEKLDGNHLLQFESDVLYNNLYYRSWAEPIPYDDPIDPSESLDPLKWDPVLTANSSGNVNPSSGLDYLLPLKGDFTFRSNFYIANNNTNTAAFNIFITIDGNEYRFSSFRGTVWSTRIYLNGSQVYSNSDGYSGAYTVFERSGTNLNVYHNGTLLYTFNGVSTEDTERVLYTADQGAGTSVLQSVEGTSVVNGEEVYGLGGWAEWKTVNKSSDISFEPYGDITETTLQLAFQQLIDDYLSKSDASEIYATKEYVDLLFKNLDWQNSIIDFYDPTSALPSGTAGDRYISLETANGWTADYIYTHNGTNWEETIPNEGFALTNETDDSVYQYLNNEWLLLQGTGGMIWRSIDSTSADLNLEAGFGYLLSADSTSYSVILPLAPEFGDEIYFFPDTGDFETNNVTIDRNGENIMSLAENLIINVNEFSFSLVYIDSSTGWRIRE